VHVEAAIGVRTKQESKHSSVWVARTVPHCIIFGRTLSRLAAQNKVVVQGFFTSGKAPRMEKALTADGVLDAGVYYFQVGSDLAENAERY
jgi:hypothetical protein